METVPQAARAYEAAIEQFISIVKRARGLIAEDRREIERLQEQARAILARLKAA